MADPDYVRERWLELQEPAALDAVRERCRAAAVEERSVSFSWWAHCPRPFPRELAGEDPRQRGHLGGAQLGVDAVGRPVYQRQGEEPDQFYDWMDTHCELIELRGGSVVKLECFVFADQRLVEEVSTEHHRVRLDGRKGVEVTRWVYEDDRPILAIDTYESGAHHSWGGPERGPHWRAKVHTFVYDADGELATITTHLSKRDLAPGGDADAAQADALVGFPQEHGSRTLYDARTRRREADLPEPERAYEGLAEPLADALHAAIERAREGLGPLEFVLASIGGTHSLLVAADATFVDRARSMTAGARELLEVAYKAPRGTVRVEVIDAAPAEVLRGLRAGEQALAAQYSAARGFEFQREVVAALNARAWRGVAPTFVVLNLPQEEHRYGQEPRGFKLPELEALLGHERVTAFLRRITGRAAPAQTEGDLRPRSRAELATLLVGAGLSAAEAERVAADALWGIVLEPSGRGVSRLGGAPVLAEDREWPESDAGQPLTHLATIALDELPSVEGREHLPDDGLLSFFVDTSEEGEFVEPVEPADENGHDLVAVIHTPAGAQTHEPEPPDEDEALSEQRVTPTARLQLRYLGFGSGERRFGIDALAARAVEHLTYRVNGGNSQQLLGYPQHVQDDPRRPGQIVLFHIDGGGNLGFDFMDAGDIHFLGTPEDIRAGRWDQITVYPNSC
jgi:hypothetical protein